MNTDQPSDHGKPTAAHPPPANNDSTKLFSQSPPTYRNTPECARSPSFGYVAPSNRDAPSLVRRNTKRPQEVWRNETGKTSPTEHTGRQSAMRRCEDQEPCRRGTRPIGAVLTADRPAFPPTGAVMILGETYSVVKHFRQGTERISPPPAGGQCAPNDGMSPTTWKPDATPAASISVVVKRQERGDRRAADVGNGHPEIFTTAHDPRNTPTLAARRALRRLRPAKPYSRRATLDSSDPPSTRALVPCQTSLDELSRDGRTASPRPAKGGSSKHSPGVGGLSGLRPTQRIRRQLEPHKSRKPYRRPEPTPLGSAHETYSDQ